VAVQAEGFAEVEGAPYFLDMRQRARRPPVPTPSGYSIGSGHARRLRSSGSTPSSRLGARPPAIPSRPPSRHRQ
jgi:hypothetical protein